MRNFQTKQRTDDWKSTILEGTSRTRKVANLEGSESLLLNLGIGALMHVFSTSSLRSFLLARRESNSYDYDSNWNFLMLLGASG